MPQEAERRVLDAFDSARIPGGAPWGTLFRKSSCGVAYAHGEADYNGHYGVRKLCDICPPQQIARCAQAWVKPDLEEVTREARSLGAVGDVEVNDRAIVVERLDEPPRYYLAARVRLPVPRPHQTPPAPPARPGPIGWTAENGPDTA